MTTDSTRPSRGRSFGMVITVAMLIGALMLASSGVLHLYLWNDKELRYRDVPTVGVLFLLQGFVGCALAIVVAIWRRWITAVAGVLFLGGSMAGLVKSINGGLFNNGETLNAPWVKTSLSIEIVGLAAFGTALIAFAVAESRATHEAESVSSTTPP